MKLLGVQITKARKRRPERLSDLRGSVRDELRRALRSYDAAAVNRHLSEHFVTADSRDADSLIRESLVALRNRARYEVRNNCYAAGVVDTKANDIIGSGPRLQLQTENNEFNKRVEDLFSEWTEHCDLSGKQSFADILKQVGSEQQDESGESFTLLQTAPRKSSWTTAKPDVHLRLQVIEPDRVTTPSGLLGVSLYENDKIHDGIEFDDFGRPVHYFILKKHPGSTQAIGGFNDFDKVPAAYVIHLYRQRRPGQSRGVPWLTPAIPLFAYLRRYTLATVSSAETAANTSGVIKSELVGDEVDYVQPMDEVEIPRNSFLTLPEGADINQLKPEQPTATYEMFKSEILNEIGRCLNMPFNVVAANSSKYNYASGRLDWQVYFRFIRVNQHWLERHYCNRVFFAWLKEAMLTPGLNVTWVDPKTIRLQWFWPGQEHVDPVKEAVAQKHRLQSLTTTLATEYARQGRDWERELEQRAREEKKMKELGLELLIGKAAGPGPQQKQEVLV